MAYDIEFGVPVPPAFGQYRKGPHVEPISALALAPVGSSVVVKAESKAARLSVGSFCNAKLGKGKFATRKVGDGLVRVWKIA